MLSMRCQYRECRYNRRLPELRKDPITGRWVIIATDRAKRPSDFIRQPVPPATAGVCPFDYGNERKTPPEVLAYRNSGGRDEPGWRVRVVPNNFRCWESKSTSTGRAMAFTTR